VRHINGGSYSILAEKTQSMKLLNSRIHGAIDYVVVIFLWLSPQLFGLSQPISILTYSLGTVHLALTVFTNFHFGLIKIIPVRVHGWIELIVGIVLITTPPLIGSYVPTENVIDKYFLASFGVVVLITWTVTDYSIES
jgi:hypothetical protein